MYYIPSFFKYSSDGGENSGVTGFWIIEWKYLFSIVILRFDKGTKEAYHSHDFNAITWWLYGSVTEHILHVPKLDRALKTEIINWYPSLIPKYTPREHLHKIEATEITYALSFRGPWSDRWKENINGEIISLTHGRKVLGVNN
tara:strand:- start:115 stop:543 length:429 start_codon:yes stop_codon:yes gene_type:complete